MLLIVTRDVFSHVGTLSRIHIVYHGETEPKNFGFGCEDVDRGLDQSMSEEDIARIKIAKVTAIPVGEYDIQITDSPKYGRPMPRIMHVPGYRGVLIHSGNTPADTEACFLPGLYRDVRSFMVTSSRDACKLLEERLLEDERRGIQNRIRFTRDATAWALFTRTQ